MAFGTSFYTLGSYFQTYGIMDFLLPFLLVFVIVFAVLEKTQILGVGKKNFNVVVSLILGLLFVAPHLMGTYPLGYDPVQIMNETIPSISMVSIAAIMLLILMGIFGTSFSKAAAPIIAIAALGFVVYIFGASLRLWTSPYSTFYWWTPEVTELLIVILIFGLIIWFITHEPSSGTGIGTMKKVWEGVSSMFEKK